MRETSPNRTLRPVWPPGRRDAGHDFQRATARRSKYDAAGHLIAERLHKLAVEADATFDRLLPTAKDWNAQLV